MTDLGRNHPELNPSLETKVARTLDKKLNGIARRERLIARRFGAPFNEESVQGLVANPTQTAPSEAGGLPPALLAALQGQVYVEPAAPAPEVSPEAAPAQPEAPVQPEPADVEPLADGVVGDHIDAGVPAEDREAVEAVSQSKA